MHRTKPPVRGDAHDVGTVEVVQHHSPGFVDKKLLWLHVHMNRERHFVQRLNTYETQGNGVANSFLAKETPWTFRKPTKLRTASEFHF